MYKHSLRKNLSLTSFSVVLLSIITLISCSKSSKTSESPNEKIINISDYVTNSMKEEEAAKKRNSVARYTGSFYINWRTTREVKLNINDTIYSRFLTGIFANESSIDTIGYVIGYVLSDGQKVFNVIGIKEGPFQDGTTLVHVSSLSGDELGTYSANGNRVTSVTSHTGPPMDQYTTIRRSWWSCTTDCIGDAVHACFGSSQCTVLLLAANATPIAPQMGTVSIAAACMASCTNNPNLDLLPAY